MHSRADENMRRALRMWDFLSHEEREGTWAMAERHGMETPMDVALEMCATGAWLRSRYVLCESTNDWKGVTVLRSTRAVILRMKPDFFPSQAWGDYSGTIVVEGIRFDVLPADKGKHRFKVQCPICDKQYGPARLIQHATIHQGE